MSHRFDACLKDLITPNPEDFAEQFGYPKVTPTVALNVDLSTISAATDIAFGLGEPPREIVDLNFQSGRDDTLPARALLYNVALHLRYEVPVRTNIVLLRPKADSPNLTGTLSYQAGETQVEFRYSVVRLWERPAEAFLHGAVSLLPLATLCQVPESIELEEWLRQVVHEIDHRLSQEKDHGQAVRLMSASFILTGLRVSKEAMAAVFKGVQMIHESTAFDVMLDQGRVEGSFNVLLKQGSRKLGTPSPEMVAELKTIHDLDRLERLAEAMLSVNSWQELLSTP